VGEVPDGATFERKIVERQVSVDARKDYAASHSFRSRLLGRRRAAG